MKTKTIGEILKAERQFHRTSLDDLSKTTRIRKEYLIALENNQFQKLPAATFVKGYIKTYGQTFEFNYKPLLAMLRRDFKESAKGKLIPREFLKPVVKRRKLWAPVTVVLMGLGSIFFAFVTYVVVQWYNLQKPPVLEIVKPVQDEAVASQVIVEGKTAPDAVVTINAQPVALQVDGSFQTEIFLPREGLNTITIEAKDRQGKSNIMQRTVRVQY